LEMKSDDPSSLVSYVNGDKNNYLFNGKEDQLQTGMYDFGARQYDPSTGRWNAPDPAKQFLDNSPYAALANNPVVNTDPDGRFVPIIAAIAIGAAIGGTANLFTHWNKIKGWKDGFAAFGIGAVAGGIAGATGGAALLAEGGAALTSLAAIGNAAAVGAYSSAAASVAQGIGNFAYFHDPYSPADFVGAAVLGGVTGGILKTAELGIAGKLNSSPDPSYKLSVNGNIRSKEVKVETGWADYVFKKGYKLRSLAEVESYVNNNHHLPDVPSEAEVKKNGVNVGETASLLLKKIEELTLYLIEKDKEVRALKLKVENGDKQAEQLTLQSLKNRELEARLVKLEALLTKPVSKE